jgi:hypothetical protein
MDRIHDILDSINESISEAAQKTYKGQKRSELKDSDFLFPQTRSFPIVTPQDIPDAISNFGRMKGQMSYDAFLKKLYNMAKRKGSEFVAALPQATKEKLGIKTAKAEDGDFMEVEDNEEETPEMEMMEYKKDFYEMSVGSIKSIATHANVILQALENPSVQEALTESWLQGKIAVTEDYMLTIHNFVMFGRSETDTEGSEAEAKKKLKIKDLPHYTYVEKDYPGVTTHKDTMAKEDRPGLWENIRKKKEKMGKRYRPAKPGEKDRPDPEQWKKLTK